MVGERVVAADVLGAVGHEFGAALALVDPGRGPRRERVTLGTPDFLAGGEIERCDEAALLLIALNWLAARLWEHLSSIETATVPRLVKLFVFVVLVGSTISVGLLPAWNAHLIPESAHRVFHFR